MHPKEDLLNQRPWGEPWRWPIELRANLEKQVPKKKCS